MTVKVPAAAGVVFVGLGWLRSTRGRERRRAAALVVAVPVATVVGVTWASGLPWTWLGPGALRVPTELRVLPTPSVALGTLSLAPARSGRRPRQPGATITVTDGLCAAVAVIAVVWLALHVRRLDEVRLIGAALTVVVLAGPTVWPWYLLWGLVLLAATSAQRSKVAGRGRRPGHAGGGTGWKPGSAGGQPICWWWRPASSASSGSCRTVGGPPWPWGPLSESLAETSGTVLDTGRPSRLRSPPCVPAPTRTFTPPGPRSRPARRHLCAFAPGHGGRHGGGGAVQPICPSPGPSTAGTAVGFCGRRARVGPSTW